MHNDEKRQIILDAFEAWERARTPGELEQAADRMFLGVRRDILLLMRDAIVKEYDAKRAERIARGLPPLQWSKDEPLPDAGTFDNGLIREAEIMKGLIREILRRQAKANLASH